MITLNNIGVTLGSYSVLSKVTVEFDPGIHWIYGANGSGKSTLLKLIVGDIFPDVGELQYGDQNVTRLSMTKRIQSGLGYLPQQNFLPPEITLAKAVSMTAELRKRLKLEFNETVFSAYAFQLGINESKFDQRIRSLSKGELRKCEFAIVAAFNNHLLILDEPFAGWDVESIGKGIQIVRTAENSGKIILIAEHLTTPNLNIEMKKWLIENGSVRSN